jgi:hypothetical protein
MTMITVGIDPGYHACKVVTEGNRTWVFPSAIAQLNVDNTFDNGKSAMENDTIRVEIDGHTWLVGKEATENGLDPDVPFSGERVNDDAFRVIWKTGLALAAKAAAAPGEVIDMRVTTGLPLRYVARDREALIKEMKKHHVVRILEKGQAIDVVFNVVKVNVVSQPEGTYFGLYLARGGALPSPTLVCDIGGKTMDVALMRGLALDIGFSRGYELGMANVGESLRPRFELLDWGFDPARAAIAIKEGKLSNGDNIQTIIDPAKRKVAQDIARKLASLPKINEVLMLVITGGGAQGLSPYILPAIKEKLPNIKNIELLENGQLANAMGFFGITSLFPNSESEAAATRE